MRMPKQLMGHQRFRQFRTLCHKQQRIRIKPCPMIRAWIQHHRLRNPVLSWRIVRSNLTPLFLKIRKRKTTSIRATPSTCLPWLKRKEPGRIMSMAMSKFIWVRISLTKSQIMTFHPVISCRLRPKSPKRIRIGLSIWTWIRFQVVPISGFRLSQL